MNTFKPDLKILGLKNGTAAMKVLNNSSFLRLPKRQPFGQRTARAFTRVDLIAVVAVIAILAPLLLFASATSQERARLARCKNNLRQIGVFLKDYSNDHEAFLPVNEAGNWPWDLDREVVNLGLEYGLQPHGLFCPSATEKFPYSMLSFSGDFAVIDYILTLPQTGGLAFTNINEKIIPQPIMLRHGEYLPTAEERELAADVVISDGVDKEFSRFMGITGGSPIEHRSSHIEGLRATGANIVFLDGHIEWRNLDDNRMTIRSTFSYPYFWY